MNASVFGGTGFIGSEFLKQNPDAHLIPRGVLSPKTRDVLYLISTTHNYHVFDDLHIDIDTNLKYLMNVLDVCRHHNVTFNFVSSWFVYGECELPAKETSPCNPRGFYSITKKCAEDLLISFCKTFKINYRILRLGNIYGPGDMNVSKKKNALQYLVNQIRDHQDIELYHGGDFVRDYLHVADTCRAISLVMENGEVNQIYNIGSGEAYKFFDLVSYARRICNSTSGFKSIPPTDFHSIVQVKDMVLDTSKLKALGFKPQFSIEDGIKQLCHL